MNEYYRANLFGRLNLHHEHFFIVSQVILNVNTLPADMDK